MAFSLVQQNVESYTGGTTSPESAAFKNPTAAGNFLLAVLCFGYYTATVTTPAGWTKLGSASSATPYGAQFIYYKTAVGGTESLSFAYTSTGAGPAWHISEWSGVDTITAPQLSAFFSSNANSSATPYTMPSTAPTVPNSECVFVVCSCSGSASYPSAPSGYTALTPTTVYKSTFSQIVPYYSTSPVSTAQSPSVAITNPTGGRAFGVFLPPGASAAVARRRTCAEEWFH